MAEFRPNEAQQAAILENGKNILVSAGAGSGKTTVLVERILRMLIEEQADIGSLIVVTFTRAAAAHMKEKIYGRIRKALEDDSLLPEQKEHLRGQMMRVFSARICTIDALCMDIVREHFQDVDMDPSFRIADEAEIRLLEQDVLSELVEHHYRNPDPEFLDLSEYYTDKNDASLETILLTLYHFSQSHPDPKAWIHKAVYPYLHARKLCETDDPEEVRWLMELGRILSEQELSLIHMAEAGLSLCRTDEGPLKYEPVFEALLTDLQQLPGIPFDEKAHVIEPVLKGWSRLPAIRKTEDVDPDRKEQAQNLYKAIREELSKLSETMYRQPLEAMFRDMADCSHVAMTIAKLVAEYSRRMEEEKKARMIADFNDVAHFALGILRTKDKNGQVCYTQAADQIARATREIIVDEYQDTNRMQDALLEALSAERFGRPNVFMVGDVKQSIYGFRMACPELFLEKYNAYAGADPGNRRIILGENYRSRTEIVDFINLVFERIMLPGLGGIDYLDGGQMSAGAVYPEPAEADAFLPELYFINGSGSDGTAAESYLIARKIEELTEEFQVTGEDGTLRKARYSDIAILTRTANHPILEKMLTDRHIPVRKSSSKGFFASFEVRLALNLLRLIDNPLQDIPFAAVLLSPLTGLSAEDLARIRAGSDHRQGSLYAAVRAFADASDDPASEALKELLELIERFRLRSQECGLHALLEELFEASGLSDLCAAMTYGEGRRANLEFLKTLADGFSKTSYAGLFQFLRYLDAMQKADMDFPGAEGAPAEDAVTMMTIHKSKGLEFPIVILADCARQIRDLDSGAPVLLDDEIGVGLEHRSLVSRIKKKTLMMQAVQARKKNQMFAEEIRLLYVALSRAKEKLILTGSAAISEARRKEWKHPVLAPDAASLLKDGSYMALLQDALKAASVVEQSRFHLRILEMEEVETERVFEQFDEAVFRTRLQERIQAAEAKQEGLDLLSEKAGIYHYDYPFASAAKANVKMTASQMEKPYEEDPEKKESIRFRPREGVLTGAERGNAYHKVMELFDYGRLSEAFPEGEEAPSKERLSDFAAQQIAEMEQKGHLSEAAAKAVDPDRIAGFLQSGLGVRMRRACLNGTLRREQQFVMGRIIDGNPEGLMQGIIDALFTEEGEEGHSIILVDYKTDRNRDEAFFRETYRGQQEAYAKACEGALQLPVSEMLLYSFELEREIRL